MHKSIIVLSAEMTDIVLMEYQYTKQISRPQWLSWMRRPTGDQEGMGSTPAEVGWSWNIFYGHSLPSADSIRAVVSFWRKNVHNTG